MALNRGFISQNGPVIKTGNLRMNARTRSSIGTFYKAVQVQTAVYEDGVQITDQAKVDHVLSSWYAAKARDRVSFLKSLETNTAQVVQELSQLEPDGWTMQPNMTENQMWDNLSNKLARIALTTADIIPTTFKIGGHSYVIKTTTWEVKGPNPLVPSKDCQTCLFENASNTVPVNSYWPNEVLQEILKNFNSRAGINRVYVDDNGDAVGKAAGGLPGIVSNGRLLYYYRKAMELQEINNHRKVDFFAIVNPNTSGNNNNNNNNSHDNKGK